MSLKVPDKKVRSRTPQEAFTIAKKYAAEGQDDLAIKWFGIAADLWKKTAA